MSPFSAHDLHDAVVVVASSGVDWHTGGFVDDDQVFIFMYDANCLCGYGRLMAVEGMAYDVAVLDVGID